MKKLSEINLRKYSLEQLKAVAEVFTAMVGDESNFSLDRNASEFAVWNTDDLELDGLSQAENQAREYARKINAGKNSRSDEGATEEEKEISRGVINWLTRQGKRRNEKKITH